MRTPSFAFCQRLRIVGVGSLTIIGSLAVSSISKADDSTEKLRIIGGEAAAPGQFPFAASLHFADGNPDPKSSQLCGAILIASDWVLTAAHCAELNFFGFEVAIGHNKLSEITEMIPVDDVYIHPDWAGLQDGDASADIALLHLSQASTATSFPKLAQPGNDLENAGTVATAIGWGSIAPNGGVTPNFLQFVDVPLLADTVCEEKADEAAGPYFDDVVCAGYEEGGKSVCYGDSGGALLVPDTNGDMNVVGIVSYGLVEQCAAPDSPAYFTRVSSYSGNDGWIQSCLDGDPSCVGTGGGDFECSDGSIIPASWRCDGANDCSDGGDEADCEDTLFTCGDGSVIPKDFECDMDRDCLDGSDEINCGFPEFTCEDGSTIPELFVCDGFNDCPGEEDEADCPPTTFECDTGEIIPIEWLCDFEPDCPGGEDEADAICNEPGQLTETIPEAPGENCPNGGLAFITGTDLNHNGVLDPDEVEDIEYLCHGINDISRSTPEPEGPNCAAGGQKVQFGLDSNGNDVLDDAEVRDTFYICNGEDGEDSPFANCSVSSRQRSPLALVTLFLAGVLGFHRRRRSIRSN